MSRTAGQDLGEMLERAVAAACSTYLATCEARITKVPTPIAQLGRVGAAGVFQARHQARAHVDFYGAFLAGAPWPLPGQAVAVECKATTAERLPLSVVAPQQREWLSDTPHGYLVVWFATGNMTRLVPWSLLAKARRGSVGPDDGWRIDAVRFLEPILRPQGRVAA